MSHITYHDVSHFQGAYKPTGPTCAKATEGNSYTDPEYAGIRSRTLAGGWPFLPYHFLRPHTIASIASQVAHVVNVIGKTSIMLDTEKEPLDTLAQQRELAQDMYDFADQYKTAGGRVTLAYFPSWEEQAIGNPSLAGLTARRIGLVSSLYGHTYSDTGPGWAAYGGVAPVIWQYTAKGGPSHNLDTNAFKGTQTELADLWKNGTAMADATLSLATQQSIADNVLVRDGHIQNYNDPTDQVSPATWSGQINGALHVPNIAADPDFASLPTTQLNTAVYRLRQDAAALRALPAAVAGIVKTEAAIQATLAALTGGTISDAQLATLAAQIKAVGDAESAALTEALAQITALQTDLDTTKAALAAALAK
jgi:hypothetical protein